MEVGREGGREREAGQGGEEGGGRERVSRDCVACMPSPLLRVVSPHPYPSLQQLAANVHAHTHTHTHTLSTRHHLAQRLH